MPNWCDNSVVLRHEDPTMIARAVSAFASGNFCAEFSPIPEELRNTTSPNRDEKQTAELLEKYGYADWYSYCVNEWGTKWDFGDGDGINDVQTNECTLFFQSAWSPPLTLMAKLEEMGFGVRLLYHECGMAFCGIYEDGYDDYYEYGGASIEDIKNQLPEELDEAFCITENMSLNEESDE